MLLSIDSGSKSIAQNAHHHHDQAGSIIAMRRGEMAHMAEVMTTKWLIGMRCTTRPVKMLSIVPNMTLGRNRIDASRADRCWTCWKLLPVLVSLMELQ